jgi:hypothetical protein
MSSSYLLFQRCLVKRSCCSQFLDEIKFLSEGLVIGFLGEWLRSAPREISNFYGNDCFGTIGQPKWGLPGSGVWCCSVRPEYTPELFDPLFLFVVESSFQAS